MKPIKICLLSISICLVLSANAQYYFKVDALKNANNGNKEIYFGSFVNLEILYFSEPANRDAALKYLKDYYLIVNGIANPGLSISAMQFLSDNPVAHDTSITQDISEKDTGSDKLVKRKIEIKIPQRRVIYQLMIPPTYADSANKKVLSVFWRQLYVPLNATRKISLSLGSAKPDLEVVNVKENINDVRFYNTWRIKVFGIVFGILLLLTIVYAKKDSYTLLRDQPNPPSNDPTKAPFSLSRVQVFVWTFVIFGGVAYLWSVTNALPIITASHLVLLGIVAGQRILAETMDKQTPPQKNEEVTRNLNKNNFVPEGTVNKPVGFFIDLISDSSGLSITRLQYLIATLIFLTVFIVTAIQQLHLPDFSIEQLGLMGTSAGLYLWNKKLDQNNPNTPVAGPPPPPPPPPPPDPVPDPVPVPPVTPTDPVTPATPETPDNPVTNT